MGFDEYGNFERVSAPHPVEGESMVKQAEADASDINQIVQKYVTHGVMPRSNPQAPLYGDFTDVGSYYDCVNRVMTIQEDFDRLPSAIREACLNDPGKLLEALEEPEKLEELVKLGMPEDGIPKREEVAPEEPVEPVEG